MPVSSPDYFFFLATLFFFYWAVRRARLAAIFVILAANCVFLGAYGLILLALVPAAATCDFLLGRFIDRSQSRAVRRLLVTTSILINVGLIVVSKYIPFIGETTHHSNWSWMLPMTLSFYAFQAMTYTIDIYRRDAKPVPSYPAYLATVSFFPTMSMGPITPVSKLAPQLLARPPLSTSDGGRALFLIGMGLAKKFFIADFLVEHLIQGVFDTPDLYSGSETLLAVYSYAFQLYYDFSASTDIVRGSALLLGINLPINFKQPYLAHNVADFWRRWHISLSNWLRDYLFFSFPGQRSKWRVYPYLVLTMAIGGFWHGPKLGFLVWGVLHGLGLAVVHGFQALRGRGKPSLNFVPRAIRVILTFHFVVFAWIFFKASFDQLSAPTPGGEIQKAFDVLRRIGSGTVSFEHISPGFLVVLGVAILAHFVPAKAYDFIVDIFSRSPALVQAAALAGLVFAIRYIAGTGATPFIYGKF